MRPCHVFITQRRIWRPIVVDRAAEIGAAVIGSLEDGLQTQGSTVALLERDLDAGQGFPQRNRIETILRFPSSIEGNHIVCTWSELLDAIDHAERKQAAPSPEQVDLDEIGVACEYLLLFADVPISIRTSALYARE
jgi:hypothetical protein